MLADMEARRAADAQQRPAREVWREMQAKAPPREDRPAGGTPAASADDPDILLLTATIEAKKAAGAAGKAVAR